MDNNMNQNNDNFYQFNMQNNNQNNMMNNNQNMNQNNMMNNNQNNGEDSFFQFKPNQSNNIGPNMQDPLGIANSSLIYEQGIYDEALLDKLSKISSRVKIGIVLFGIMALVGLILLLIGFSSSGDGMPNIVIGSSLLATGAALVLVLLPSFLRSNKTIKTANREVLRNELNQPHYFLVPCKTYFTNNYIIGNYSETVIARYSDIVWAYEEAKGNTGYAVGGVLGAAVESMVSKAGNINIVLVLNNKKKYRFPCANMQNVIYSIITRNNPNVIIGKSRDAKKMYNQVKNTISNNQMVNNNYGNMGQDQVQQNMYNQNNMYNNQMNNNNNQGPNNF